MRALALGLVALLALPGPGRSQATGPEDLVEGFARAWNTHDLELFGALFAEDADWVNVAGARSKGRAAIQAVLEKEHVTWARTTSFSVTRREVRVLRADVALVDFDWEVTGAVDRDGNPAVPTRGTTLFVAAKDLRGGWRVVAGHVRRHAAVSPPPAAPRLEKLEVLADGHPLTVWAKRPPSPRGAILLVHGRTFSALPNFDLRVEGYPRSVMDSLYGRGYAAYALDQRGYGASPRDASGWLTPTRAARDVSIALEWIHAREGRPRDRPVLVGYSRGSVTSLLAAQRHPDAASALILYAFLRDLDERVPVVEPKAAPPRERTTAEFAASDFVLPGAAPRAVIDAYAAQALAADPVRVDWRDEHEFNALDPSKVVVPTLIIHGVADPRTSAEKDMKLLSRLGTADRTLVVLPSSDHAAHVEDVQPAWVDAIVAFIERPRAAPAGR